MIHLFYVFDSDPRDPTKAREDSNAGVTDSPTQRRC